MKHHIYLYIVVNEWYVVGIVHFHFAIKGFCRGLLYLICCMHFSIKKTKKWNPNESHMENGWNTSSFFKTAEKKKENNFQYSLQENRKKSTK